MCEPHREEQSKGRPGCLGKFTPTRFSIHMGISQIFFYKLLLKINIPASNDYVYIFCKKYPTLLLGREDFNDNF